jgi:hypothetical protein
VAQHPCPKSIYSETKAGILIKGKNFPCHNPLLKRVNSQITVVGGIAEFNILVGSKWKNN